MTAVKLRPVTGWTIQTTNNFSMLLNLVTVGSEAEIDYVGSDRATPENVAALMSPQQCLDLSDDLRRNALAMMAKYAPAAHQPH